MLNKFQTKQVDLNLTTGMFSYAEKSGSKPKIIQFRVSVNFYIEKFFICEMYFTFKHNPTLHIEFIISYIYLGDRKCTYKMHKRRQ